MLFTFINWQSQTKKKKNKIVETVTNYTLSLLEDSFWFLVIHNTAKEDEVLNCL